jgi:hypothetical protein
MALEKKKFAVPSSVEATMRSTEGASPNLRR